MDGYPGVGHQTFAFLDVPEFVSPPTFTPGHSIGMPMEWEIYDADVYVMLMLIRENNVIWRVDFGWEATSGLIPQPPSNLDSASYLGAELLEGNLFVFDEEMIGGYSRRAGINQLHINPL